MGRQICGWAAGAVLAWLACGPVGAGAVAPAGNDRGVPNREIATPGNGLAGKRAAGADFARRFAAADRRSGAMFRWWWPGSHVEHAELVAELDEIADAGYKGVEIADVMYGVDYPVDPDRYGYGNQRWIDAVEAVLEAARARGLEVDLTLGAHWPAAVPGLDVDEPASSKELAYGYRLVADGARFYGAAPSPPTKTYTDRTSDEGVIESETKVATPQLVGVSALRCVDKACSAKPLPVDLGSSIDLTDLVVDGALEWVPPNDGTWVLVGQWYRGTAQLNDAPFGNLAFLYNDPEARVVDHFGENGTRAFTEYFETVLPARTADYSAV